MSISRAWTSSTRWQWNLSTDSHLSAKFLVSTCQHSYGDYVERSRRLPMPATEVSMAKAEHLLHRKDSS
jgi:hypothetical protein